MVFGLLAVVHLGQSAAYWLWIDAPRAYQANQNWSVVDRIVKEIDRDPGQVAIADAAESDCQGLWLELDWCYQLREFKEHPGPHVRWVVEPAGKKPVRGFSIRQVDGPVQLLCRDAPVRLAPRRHKMGDTRRKSPEIPDEASPAMSLLTLQDRPAGTSRATWNDRDWAIRFVSRIDVRLGIVLVVCFIPRAIAAWRLPAACDDAYYYLHVADSLQGGRVARALEYLNINVYPMVLIGLHRMGLDWIFAAKMWGVLTGTAIVLPLFDWLRRMFNDRIALLAVFLYAVHPRIVEPTVEPLREATFWFFFVVCLDLFWRAAEERRTWQFAAGGLSLALALHTRIEAWFLLAPLGVWMGMSWWQSRAARPRLVVGTLLCLAITPFFVFAVNVTLLAHHYQWELGRLSPFLLVEKWIHTPVANDAAAASLAAPATRPAALDAPIPKPNTSVAIPAIPHAEEAAKLEGTVTETVSVPRQYFREMAPRWESCFWSSPGSVSSAGGGNCSIREKPSWDSSRLPYCSRFGCV